MDTDAFYKITQGLYVLGAADGDKYAGSLVDAVMQAANRPLVLAVSCHNGSYTKECIERSRRFSLSALSQDIAPRIIGNFGFYSSRNRDKWQYVEHQICDGLPLLTDNIAAFICDVLQVIPFESNTLILGQVVSVQNNQNKVPITYQYYRTNLKDAVAAECQKKMEVKMSETKEKHWVCTVCGYVYDGDVPFEELPDSWVCPLCGVDKSYFVYE